MILVPSSGIGKSFAQAISPITAPQWLMFQTHGFQLGEVMVASAAVVTPFGGGYQLVIPTLSGWPGKCHLGSSQDGRDLAIKALVTLAWSLLPMMDGLTENPIQELSQELQLQEIHHKAQTHNQSGLTWRSRGSNIPQVAMAITSLRLCGRGPADRHQQQPFDQHYCQG